VVERVELNIDGMYWVQDILHHCKYLIFPRYVHQESPRLTVAATTDLFLVTLQSAVLLARSVFRVTLHL